MKIRFNRLISVLCAVMLLISAFSAWAAAESTPATPTDLSPVEENVPGEPSEEQPTEPEDNPTEEQGQEPEKDPEQEPVSEPEDETTDETVDSAEMLITKTLTVGQSWDGKMKKTKPAILRVNVERPQRICLLIEGQDVWVTVEKEDEVSETVQRYYTDAETNRLLLFINAEATSYLITLGPVEPYLLAIASVSVMDEKAFEAWEEEQQLLTANEITESEQTEENNESEQKSVEETEVIVPEETAENMPEESETDGIEEPTSEEENVDDAIAGEEDSGEENLNTEETSDLTETEDTKEQPEEQSEEQPEGQPEEQEIELPDDDVLLSLGYYKTQVAIPEGTGLFETIDDDAEPIELLETGTDVWVTATEDENWALVFSADPEAPVRYIRWEALIITLKPENEEEEEPLPTRYIEITSTLSEMKYIALGTDITMKATLCNFRNDDICEFQWQYYDETTGAYVDIDGANEPIYTYQFSLENMSYHWKLVVTIQNEDA